MIGQESSESKATAGEVSPQDFRFYVASRAFDLCKHLITAAMWLGLGYLGVEAIGLLAGQKTEASFAVSYLSSANSEEIAPWLVAFAAIVFASMERRLRLRKTEYMQARIRELEQLIDPSRTTSGLLPNGQTHPKDRAL